MRGLYSYYELTLLDAFFAPYIDHLKSRCRRTD